MEMDEEARALGVLLMEQLAALQGLRALIVLERSALADFRVADHLHLVQAKEEHVANLNALEQRRTALLELAGPLASAQPAVATGALALAHENAALAQLLGRFVEVVGAQQAQLAAAMGGSRYDPQGRTVAQESRAGRLGIKA